MIEMESQGVGPGGLLVLGNGKKVCENERMNCSKPGSVDLKFINCEFLTVD